MTALVAMVAPNGARRTKADHGKLPITPAEIADEAARCAEAGASVLHLHVRTDDGRHSLDAKRYRRRNRCGAPEARRAHRDPGHHRGGGRYGPAEQMAMVRELHPEAVSLALAELIPDEGATDDATAFLAWLKRERIAPQYILYAPDEVVRFHDLRARGVIPQRRPFALFVLGRYGGTSQAQPRDLLPFLAVHDAACPWSACAFGRREAACVLAAAGLGGHARVGFENNLWRADGSLAASNADLVEQVAAGARLLGRAIADVATTRAFLAETAG